EGDRIDLSALGVESLDDLTIIPGPNGGSVIAFGNSSIQLDGVAPTNLTEDMFIFGSGADQEAGVAIGGGNGPALPAPADAGLAPAPADAAFAELMAIAQSPSAEMVQAANSFAASQQWASPFAGIDLSGFATAAFEPTGVDADIPLDHIVEMPASLD